MARDPRLQQALEEYGAQVRRRREKSDMTQAEMARRSGVSQSYLSKIERGQHEPTIGQMLRIQRALGAETLEGFLGPEPGARWMRIDACKPAKNAPGWG